MEGIMKEFGKMLNYVVKEFMKDLKERNMKEYGKMENITVKGYILFLMVLDGKVNGKMTLHGIL